MRKTHAVAVASPCDAQKPLLTMAGSARFLALSRSQVVEQAPLEAPANPPPGGAAAAASVFGTTANAPEPGHGHGANLLPAVPPVPHAKVIASRFIPKPPTRASDMEPA